MQIKFIEPFGPGDRRRNRSGSTHGFGQYSSQSRQTHHEVAPAEVRLKMWEGPLRPPFETLLASATKRSACNWVAVALGRGVSNYFPWGACPRSSGVAPCLGRGICSYGSFSAAYRDRSRWAYKIIPPPEGGTSGILSKMRNKPKCETLGPWLKANLGKNCLAPTTNIDALALASVAQIVELFAYTQEPEVVKAFGIVVRQMQASTRELAYHSIAHSLDWRDRDRIWAAAGLDPIAVRKCAYEPDAPLRSTQDQRRLEGGGHGADPREMSCHELPNDDGQ